MFRSRKGGEVEQQKWKAQGDGRPDGPDGIFQVEIITMVTNVIENIEVRIVNNIYQHFNNLWIRPKVS